MAKRKTSPRDVNVLARAGEALELRAKGNSFATIATILKCGKTTAYRLVIDHMVTLADRNLEAANRLLDRELVHTDILLERCMLVVDNDSIEGVHAAVRVLDRRAKYLGLDAPAKQQVTVTHADAPKSAETLLAEIRQKIGQSSTPQQRKPDHGSKKARTARSRRQPDSRA